MVEDDMDFEWKKKINKTWFHPLIDYIHIVIHDAMWLILSTLTINDMSPYGNIFKYLEIIFM